MLVVVLGVTTSMQVASPEFWLRRDTVVGSYFCCDVRSFLADGARDIPLV